MSRLRKTRRRELIVFENGNIPLEQDLERARHVAPISRSAHDQTRTSLQQLSDAMAVVLRKDALLVGPAFQAPDARLYGKTIDIDPLHFGAGRTRFPGNDSEERRC